jgi:hypothetical protein
VKQQFIVDIAGTFKAYIYQDNRKVVPTSATLTVTQPGTTTVVVNAQAMGVASDGLLSYSLTTDNNDTLNENYKAVIAYVLGGETFYETLFYDVVNAILSKVITDDDLFLELPSLRPLKWKIHGQADSGSTTTIVDAELKDNQEYFDDYFTGGTAYSIDRDETRDITDFVASTGTLTTIAFSGVISTDKYILSRSFSREIQRSFEKIEEKIVNLGRRPELILDPYDLREIHILFAVAEVCKGLMTINEEFYWALMDRYEEKGEVAFRDKEFKYDKSDDGIISASEEPDRIGKTTVRS